MTSNEEWTIAQLFDSAFDLQQKLQESSVDGTKENYNLALGRFKSAEERLEELHLFSDNEELSEVATNELRYFIIYALIGWLHEFRPSDRETRLDDLQAAIRSYIKYLQLCSSYGLVKEVPKEHEENDNQLRLSSPEDRLTKIQKLKEKKSLEQSIAKLRSIPHADDEIKRQLYTEQIRWWIRQAEEEIAALKDERKILAFAKEPIPPVNPTKATSQLPVNGPFTIVKTKDQLYREAVGGAGYPSLPTMTVDEFYQDLAARQAQQPAPPAKPPTRSTEELEEIDDSQHRENVRRMDEFKEDNPRGYGNRYNRS